MTTVCTEPLFEPTIKGKPIIVCEPDDVGLVRYLFTILSLTIGVAALWRMTMVYSWYSKETQAHHRELARQSKARTSPPPSPPSSPHVSREPSRSDLTQQQCLSSAALLFDTAKFPSRSASLFWLVFICNVVHIWHFADNITRPVAYREPQYLYVKRVFGTMEITFFWQMTMTFFCERAVDRLYSTGSVAPQDLEQSLRMGSLYMSLYAFLSTFAFGHWLVDPPYKYSWLVNGSVGGETGISVIVLFYMFRLYCAARSRSLTKTQYQPVVSMEMVS